MNVCLHVCTCTCVPGVRVKSEEDDMKLELRMAVSDHVGAGI